MQVDTVWHCGLLCNRKNFGVTCLASFAALFFCACGNVDLDGTRSGKGENSYAQTADPMETSTWNGESSGMALTDLPGGLMFPRAFAVKTQKTRESASEHSLLVWGQNPDGATCSAGIYDEQAQRWQSLKLPADAASNCNQVCAGSSQIFYCSAQSCYSGDFAGNWTKLAAEPLRDRMLLRSAPFQLLCEADGGMLAAGDFSDADGTEHLTILRKSTGNESWVEVQGPAGARLSADSHIEVIGQALILWTEEPAGAHKVSVKKDGDWSLLPPPVELPADAHVYVVPTVDSLIVRYHSPKRDRTEAAFYGQFRYRLKEGRWQLLNESLPLGSGISRAVVRDESWFWGGEKLSREASRADDVLKRSCFAGGIGVNADFTKSVNLHEREYVCRGRAALAILPAADGKPERLAVFGGCTMLDGKCSSWSDLGGFFLSLPGF